MLAPLNTGDVIAELCVCVDQALDGVGLDVLCTAPGVRFLPNTNELVAAAQKGDLVALGAAVDIKTATWRAGCTASRLRRAASCARRGAAATS